MATKTEINQMFLEDLYKIYATAEVKMLEKVAKRVKKGITTEGWNEAKLKNVQQLREEIDKIMSDVNNITKFALEKEIKKAYNKGIKGASMDLGMPTTIMKDMVPFHLQRLILQTHNIVDNTSVQILRNTEDVYREVIAETTTGILSGVDTRMQASQDALNRFAAKGITGFVDKSGRNWELASYVEMATRTTAAHAALQGHIDRCLELDHDLIIVSSHAATCPVCAPWGGKPLSISGKTPGYATLEQARADGLFHPNCKHTVTAYFPFIDEPEGHEHDKGYNPEQYEATQIQRHNERQIRKWKRLEAVALTDAERKKAQNKIRYWQYVQRQHVEEYNLKRKYAREGIKSRVGDATKVKDYNINIPKPKAPEAAIKSISIFDADGIKMELTYDEVMKMSTGEKKFIIKQKGININKDINNLDKNELDEIMNKMFNVNKAKPNSAKEEPKPKKQKVGPPKAKPINKIPNVDRVDYEPLSSKEVKKSISESKDWFGLSENRDYMDSFIEYTGDGYTWMNDYYRKGIELDRYGKQHIEKMEEGFKKAPRAFDRDTQVYRATGYSYLRNAGIDDDIIKEVEKIKHKLEDSSQYGLALTDQKVKDMEELLRNRMIDKVVTEKSFTSTAYKYGAFGSDKDVQLIINAPVANSNAVQLAGISQYSSESEILFAPGMDNLIEDVFFEVIDEGWRKRARVRVKVRVLGHNTVK